MWAVARATKDNINIRILPTMISGFLLVLGPGTRIEIFFFILNPTILYRTLLYYTMIYHTILYHPLLKGSLYILRFILNYTILYILYHAIWCHLHYITIYHTVWSFGPQVAAGPRGLPLEVMAPLRVAATTNASRWQLVLDQIVMDTYKERERDV